MDTHYRCVAYDSADATEVRQTPHARVRGERCPLSAVGVLRSPDGFNAGGLCWEHGTRVLVEYAAKLGEQWTVDPLPLT